MSLLAQDFHPKVSDLLNCVLVGFCNLHTGNGMKPFIFSVDVEDYSG